MPKRAPRWSCAWKRSRRDGPPRWKIMPWIFSGIRFPGCWRALAFARNCFVPAYSRLSQTVFKNLLLQRAARNSSKQTSCEVVSVSREWNQLRSKRKNCRGTYCCQRRNFMAFASIHVPNFPVQAVVRSEPGLRNQAVALVDGTPPIWNVVAGNEAALLAGIELGMSKSQAAQFHAVEIRNRSRAQEKS